MSFERRPDGFLVQPDHDSILRDVEAGTRCASCRFPFAHVRDGKVETTGGFMHNVCAVREGHVEAAPKASVRFSKQDLFA